MNSPFHFVLCGWYLWWSRILVRGSRMTAVDDEEWDSFVEPSSRRDDIEIILGESCILLINSSIAGSIIILLIWGCKSQIYLYVRTNLPLIFWMMCIALLYSCVCIWLSNGVLSKSVYVYIYYGVQIYYNIFYISKLTKFSLKI